MLGMTPMKCRAWRDLNNVTQEMLAAEADVDQAQISRWELGRGKPDRANSLKVKRASERLGTATGTMISVESWDWPDDDTAPAGGEAEESAA